MTLAPHRHLSLLIMLCAMLAPPMQAAHAQGPRPSGFRQSTAAAPPAQPASQVPGQPGHSEWKKGAAIGAAAGAAAFVVAWFATPHLYGAGTSDRNFALIVVPVAVFALIGGLIGSQTHRH
jgi:hypothetical protein